MANEQNLKPFQPGHDPRRDNSGRKPKIPELDELLADVLSEETDGISAAAAILRGLVKSAKRGNVRAAEVLLNRAYGAPRSSVDVRAVQISALPSFDVEKLTDAEAAALLELMEKAKNE